MSFHVSEINIGQTYELYKEDYVDSYHYTILVDGIIRTLAKEFVTEQEYRKRKINNILT